MRMASAAAFEQTSSVSVVDLCVFAALCINQAESASSCSTTWHRNPGPRQSGHMPHLELVVLGKLKQFLCFRNLRGEPCTHRLIHVCRASWTVYILRSMYKLIEMCMSMCGYTSTSNIVVRTRALFKAATDVWIRCRMCNCSARLFATLWISVHPMLVGDSGASSSHSDQVVKSVTNDNVIG